MHRITICLLFSLTGLFLQVSSFAQLFFPKNYPQDYFAWPVSAKIALAANFGELRPNHYHMGLDCKTDQKENVPVLAAADGYIARVKIEPFGFGRSININHPNGLTTLYAHLNDFYPELEKYIQEQQYIQQKWQVTITIPENLFPVKKGQYIAKSGNTGGSQGPHLHFEIRDTKSDKVLNPLLFGFPVADNIAPDILRLAIYDRTISSYEQTARYVLLKKTSQGYVPVTGEIIVQSERVSFAITAYDRYTGSTNQNGIFRAELQVNDQPVCGFEMDSISYDETRYLNAHIDYKTKSLGGPYLQHLSKPLGYSEGIYRSINGSNGIVRLNDETIQYISIIVYDAQNNQSKLSFPLKRSSTITNKATSVSLPLFQPGFVNVFENDQVRFYLPEKSLYDSFRFQYREINSANGPVIYQLHRPEVPIHQYFDVHIRGDFELNDTGKIIMKRFYGSKDDYKKATCIDGWYRAAFREFGNFQLLIDSIPPVIKPLGFHNGMSVRNLQSIRLSISDNMEDIRFFEGRIDGKWVCFSNDKGKIFKYEFDEYCAPGSHVLDIIAEDLAGNKQTVRYNFTR